MSDPNHSDLSSHFHGLNMSAQPFVPSVRAPAFQPVGNYNQMYGGGGQYHLGGPPQPVPGMYHGMPYHMHGGYNNMSGRGGRGGYMHHGMPYQQQNQQGRPPLHQMNPHSHVPTPDHSSNRGGIKDQSSQQQQQQQQHQHHFTGGNQPINVINQNKTASPILNVSAVDTPVDSWEDITVAEETPSKPDPSLNQTTKKPANPVATTTCVTNNNTTTTTASSSSSSSSSNSSPPQPQHQELPIKNSERKWKDSSTESAVPKPSRSVLQQIAPVKRDDEKENVNIVFIGHVDAGKSTIGGHLMYLTGQVDKRTLEKYEREAKEKNRETWYLSWALDTNQEERDKGKTVEVGRAAFETDKKRFTILDAPGHAGFVPSMISGTVQADIGILVISARRGEFETGFERRGQTREHAMLAKTAGVKHLVVLVNKMDDPTVCWDEGRYEDIKTKLTPFLKKVGFNPKTDINYIPVSGLTGANLKILSDDCSWYNGSAFLPYLEDLPPITREDEGPLRIPVADKYKDMGTMVIGKVESGSIGKGSILMVMPNRTQVEVLTVIRNEDDVVAAFSGDNIKLKLKGIEDEDVSPGFVLCNPNNVCHTGRVFDAQVVILEYKSIICAGFSCVLHIHNVVEEVEIINLIARVDKKTGKKVPEKPKFIKQDQTAVARFQASGIICMESFKDFPPMARFTLRDEGKTIAIGKVLKIIE